MSKSKRLNRDHAKKTQRPMVEEQVIAEHSTDLDFKSRSQAAVHSAPLNTFPEALKAFRTAMSYRFVSWLSRNRDLFIAHKASLGFVWA